MTLRLLLLRHAKSSWKLPGVEDFDRPLTGGGRKAMAAMGPIVGRKKYRPDHILCSSAKRTRETLGELLPHLPKNVEVTFTREIYEADADALLKVIAGAAKSVRSLMLIGHNPGFHQLALGLAGGGDDKDLRALGEDFPTAALAVVDFDAGDWSGIRPGKGKLAAFITPKDAED
jgi:phosphohistidine phosphatase